MSSDVGALPLAERQQAALRVCFAREPADSDLHALGAPERWKIYRQLVRDRLERMLRAGLPRTVDTVGDAAFRASFTDWLASSPPATHYIRDVVGEFVGFAAPRWQSDASLRPWAADLAHYERALWDAALAEDRLQVEVVDFEFDRVPVLNPTLELLRLRHPVHERRKAGEHYPEQPTSVCVYRPRDDFKAATWTLNDLAADLVQAWRDGERTVTESVQAVTRARGVAIDQGFIDKLSGMLADFIERGILLGSKA